MDIRVLRYFLVLAEELHFGRAASRLHISQPPLSQQIRLLEEEIGAPLFERAHHNVTLTPAGYALKEQVPIVFEKLDQAVAVTRQAGRGQHGELSIGIISSAMVDVLADALHYFSDRYPDVKWQLQEMTPVAQITALEEKRVDLCIFRVGYNTPDVQQSNAPHITKELLMTEPLCAVLPKVHPLSCRENLELVDLANETFVTFKLGQSRLADFLYQTCVDAGFKPDVSHQVIEAQTLLRLVCANFGVALLPASMEQLAPAGVVFQYLTPSLPEVPLYEFYRANDESPVLKLFRDALRQQCIPA